MDITLVYDGYNIRLIFIMRSFFDVSCTVSAMALHIGFQVWVLRLISTRAAAAAAHKTCAYGWWVTVPE